MDCKSGAFPITEPVDSVHVCRDGTDMPYVAIQTEASAKTTVVRLCGYLHIVHACDNSKQVHCTGIRHTALDELTPSTSQSLSQASQLLRRSGAKYSWKAWGQGYTIL